MTSERPGPGLSRRHALAGVATVGVGVPLLAACGATTPRRTSECDRSGRRDHPLPVPRQQVLGRRRLRGQRPRHQALPTAEVAVEGEDVAVDGAVIAQASDIPEGGGTIFADEDVVVTQPEAGTSRLLRHLHPPEVHAHQRRTGLSPP